MKILLAVDGSDYTRRLLEWLANHPQLLGDGPELVFFHAVSPLPPHVSRYLDAAVLEGYANDQAREVLDPVAAFAQRRGWRFETKWATGRAADTIAEFARAGRFDLLAIGSHGHSPVTSLVLGSVAQRLLWACTTPVLIVR